MSQALTPWSVKGIDEETVNSILEVLPKKKQAMYTPIEKPMRKKDVMAARKVIVGLASEMAKSCLLYTSPSPRDRG